MIKCKPDLMLVAAMLIGAALNQVSAAQDIRSIKNKTPEQRAQLQTSLLKSKLKLDTLVIVKLQAINLKYAQKMEPIIKGDEGKLKKYRAVIAIQKAKDAELRKLFSAEQYRQYQKLEDELKDKIRHHMKN